jgi:pSer/pThr/pTyr-binding forkhead associated (FHA) protein
MPFVSRHHCSFFVQDGRVWVQDLNSRNGTFVNDEEALRPQRLRDGDEVRLGSLSARVALRSAARRDPESGMLVGGGKDDTTHKS